MKKFIIIISIIILVLSLNKNNDNKEEMIRFRIIASSNEEKDQKLKREIINSISKDLINNNIKTIEEERNYLKNNLPTFENKIKEKTDNYTINYGYNYFPKKTYRNKTYEEGEYESLVITLGEGKGNNFWCILFPPLCMVDEDQHDIEYKSFIKEVINKVF